MEKVLIRQYVYDAPQRILHWWLALGVLTLGLTGIVGSNIEPGPLRSYVWLIHIFAGKFLVVGFVGRLVWGLIGSAHARFFSFIHSKSWLNTLRTRKIHTADDSFGHHSQASLSYLVFYVMIFMMIGTGLILAAVLHGEGPLAPKYLDNFEQIDFIAEIHELMWIGIVLFVISHVAALIYHERSDRIPIAQSMISGFQYRTKKENLDAPN